MYFLDDTRDVRERVDVIAVGMMGPCRQYERNGAEDCQNQSRTHTASYYEKSICKPRSARLPALGGAEPPGPRAAARSVDAAETTLTAARIHRRLRGAVKVERLIPDAVALFVEPPQGLLKQSRFRIPAGTVPSMMYSLFMCI